MADDLDEPVRQVLAEFDTRAERERALHRSGWDADERRDRLLLRIGPATGRLLNILIKGARARRILELGTSYGYSTVWLAEAARETGGKVVTLDLAGYKQEHARAALDRARLAEFVDWRTGDALDLLPALEGSLDFVLIDLWKELYVRCFDLIAPRLALGALVVADNMLEPAYSRPQADAYRAHVHRRPGFESVLLEVGSGIYVTRRVAD